MKRNTFIYVGIFLLFTGFMVFQSCTQSINNEVSPFNPVEKALKDGSKDGKKVSGLARKMGGAPLVENFGEGGGGNGNCPTCHTMFLTTKLKPIIADWGFPELHVAMAAYQPGVFYSSSGSGYTIDYTIPGFCGEVYHGYRTDNSSYSGNPNTQYMVKVHYEYVGVWTGGHLVTSHGIFLEILDGLIYLFLNHKLIG